MLVQNPRRAIVGKTLVSLLSLSGLGPQVPQAHSSRAYIAAEPAALVLTAL